MRMLPALAATAVAFALTATPAQAAQVYAGQPSGASPFQFVMSLDNAGKQLTGFTFHFDVSCPTDFRSVDSGTARIVADMPENFMFGDHYMVGAKIKGTKLTGTFTGFDQVGETLIERMSAVLTGTLKPGQASGRVAVEFKRLDTATDTVVTQCSRNVPWKALRDPGHVYAGTTSQDEPVVVELTKNRRQVDHSHFSWWADCQAQ